MRLMIGITGIIAALLVEQPAAAAPMDYNCDTPVGSYSQLVQTQAGPAYHVRATITPLTWRDDPERQWAPVGGVRLESADGTRWIAVRIGRQPAAERGSIEIRVKTGGEPRTTVLGDVGLNEALPVELQALPSGDVVVVIRGQRQVIHLDLGRNAKVEATCSTGEFLFGGLDLGG
jgi:hypothetical protein